MRENIIRLALAAVAALALAACGAGGENLAVEPPPEAEDGVLIYAALNPLSEDRSKLIEKFNAAHEDIQVEVRDYSDENGMQRLFTELALGQVPDIMEMHRLGEGKDTAWFQTPYLDRLAGEDWMPYRQLVEKGYLEDLWPYIENDPELGLEGVLMPPLKAAEVNGGLYMLFSDVSVTTMISPERVVGTRIGWTFDEMLETFSAMPEGSTIMRYNATREDIFFMLCAPLLDQYVDWETGQNSFDSRGFRDMMEFLGAFPAELKTFLSQEKVESEIAERMLTGHQMLEAVTIAALWYLPGADTFFGERAAYVGYPTADGSLGSYFNLHGSKLSMSSTCRNKDAAWDFIRQAVAKKYGSTEIRDLHTYGEEIKTPVVRKYYEMANRFDMKDTLRADFLCSGPLNTSYFKWERCTTDHLQRYETLINNTTQIYWPNSELSDIVWESISPYFTGDKTLDDTVSLIQNRVQLYVNENR